MIKRRFVVEVQLSDDHEDNGRNLLTDLQDDYEFMLTKTTVRGTFGVEVMEIKGSNPFCEACQRWKG